MNCDKCGFPVHKSNDATWVESFAFSNPFVILAGGARHFLPEGLCPGSPSRAQYIEGQPRDPRYPYDVQHEAAWRLGYARVQEECNKPQEGELDGKKFLYTDNTEFLVQVGRGPKGSYQTKYSFVGSPGLAVRWYNGINIGNGYKKRIKVAGDGVIARACSV